MLRLILQSIIEGILTLISIILFSHQRIQRNKARTCALVHPEKTSLGQQVKSLNMKKPDSGFHLLINNLQAFSSRCELISQAEQTLDLQYYYFHADTSGHMIASLLVDAANRGVRVRILLDDIDTLGADEAIRILNSHPGIEIRIFNPFRFRGLLRYLEFIANLARVGRRMHNKAMVADNTIAIIGGRNIGDIYFAADPDLLFLDVDLLTIGPIVKEISCSFDEYWNSAWAIQVDDLYPRADKPYAVQRIKAYLNRYVQEVDNSDFINDLQSFDMDGALLKLKYTWADAQLFYDAPSKVEYPNKHKTTAIIDSLRELVNSAEHELIFVTPYFVPAKDTLEWFEQLVNRGIRIQILTNSLAATDVIAVHAGYKRHRLKLLKMGIKLYELKPTAYAAEKKKFRMLRAGSRTSLHAKTIIIDRQKVFIGSPNLDPRSKDLNTEMGLLVDNKVMADQVCEIFEAVTSGEDSYMLELNTLADKTIHRVIWRSHHQGEDVVSLTEPDVGWWRRLRLSLYSLLPIEGLL